MASSTNWLSLKDLGQIYGISAMHCGRALQKEGWRDNKGFPTPRALNAGAASIPINQKPALTPLWNEKICKILLEKTGYKPLSKKIQIQQWTILLEELAKGSPSIQTTPQQMAEEMPKSIIKEVNTQLINRGCVFQVKEKN